MTKFYKASNRLIGNLRLRESERSQLARQTKTVTPRFVADRDNYNLFQSTDPFASMYGSQSALVGRRRK